MAQYRNKRTGAIISISGIITGDTWELLDAKPKKAEPAIEPIEVEPIKPEKKAPKKRRSKK